MPSNEHSTDRTDSLTALQRLRRIDATISKWGYGVSGWAGVFVGALALFGAKEADEAIHLTGAADALVGPLVWLVLAYALLGLAYKYRQRYGAPSCNV